eukprot:gene7334-9997_t
MRVVRICLDQLQQLLRVNSCCIVLIEATWCRPNVSNINRYLNNHIQNSEINPIDTLIHTLSATLRQDETLYLIQSEGNDEVENYMIDVVQIKSLPCLICFKGTAIAFKVEGQELFQINQIGLMARLHTFNIMLDNSRHFSNILDVLFRQTINDINDRMTPQAFACEKKPLILFIAGDKSSVGKSSICLGILGKLLSMGVNASQLGYIKPITQCEAEQPVSRFCQRKGIAYLPIGPVVFYQGFTRAFLANETEPSQVLLDQVLNSVKLLSYDKRFVLVDGVGYPSVGSICGVSNADVAKILNAPVLLIGKSGVGDAIDSFNLNANYFENHGVTVLGGIFNKIPLDGYYNLNACKESINSYFRQYQPHREPYGFLPLLNISSSDSENEYVIEEALRQAFTDNVDIARLLRDVWLYHINSGVVSQPGYVNNTTNYNHSIDHRHTSTSFQSFQSNLTLIPQVSQPINRNYNENQTSFPITSRSKRSREEVVDEARSKGAKGG